jgi:FixJ family two-component response regulator
MQLPAQNSPVRHDAEHIIVVDDEEAMREALAGLLRTVGLSVATYGSIAEMQADRHAPTPSCLVLDVRLPGVSGLDFQSVLAQGGHAPPIIFMTGYGDIPMTVRAMKAGALDFLTKPFRDQDLLDAVSLALQQERIRRAERGSATEARGRYETLTTREKEVMVHVVAGLMNKQIAHKMGVSEITVKVHRGSVMRKMQVRSLPDLVRISEMLPTGRSLVP